MKTKTLSAILLLALLLSSCGRTGETDQKKKYTASRLELFDTVILLTGYAESEAAFRETADGVFAELEELHRLYDAYNEYEGLCNICTINRNAGKESLSVDERIMALLCFSEELAQVTAGRVDVTAGSVLRLWHEARENARLPDVGKLTEAAKHRGFERLEMDTARQTLRLTDPETLLDVGAVAKGFALRQVREMLPAGWLLNAGGNIYASGEKPDGSLWTVGIQDPDGSASELIQKLPLRQGAVATSGDYQRYFTLDGTRYHHLIDLETLMPAGYWRSVTVLCDDPAVADGLSTALFLMEREEGEALLERYHAAAWWVDGQGELFASENMDS